MNLDFDRRLRESLDAASAADLLPGFDKDALWPQIQARAKRRPAMRIALPWLSHAAAVAAGLLLAWAVLPTSDRSETRRIAVASASVAVTVKGERPPGQAQEALERHNGVDEKAIVTSGRAGHKASLSRTVVQEQPVPRAHPEQTVEADTQPTVAATSAPDSTPSIPPAVVQTWLPKKEKLHVKQPAPVIVHLLDVTGESGERLRRPVELLPARRSSFFARLLSRNKVPDLTGTAAADVVVQRTYLSR